ncbi:pyrimidine reductase family protein [Salinactinospora qingdaonensis]|uniref:Pyrimidine reductase family protein n=1 Tax=Salinactinospora qingdaonensis TaxID=702744 RepID=A0ABP7F4U0_9ACTN
MSSVDSASAPSFRRLLPEPCGDVDVAAAYAYPQTRHRPWLRANMVASADGAAWGPSGRTVELSDRADRRMLVVLRGLADVVLAGAATARIEGYRPVRQREIFAKLREGRATTPPIAVVTRTLNIHPRLLADAPEESRTIVVTTESAPAERRRAAAEHAEVVVAGEESVDPEALIAALGARGLFRVLCEGGPHLLAELSAAGLVDELCLTVSPHLLGPAASRIVSGDTPSHTQDLELSHVLEAQGSLFLRYTRH